MRRHGIVPAVVQRETVSTRTPRCFATSVRLSRRWVACLFNLLFIQRCADRHPCAKYAPNPIEHWLKQSLDPGNTPHLESQIYSPLARKFLYGDEGEHIAEGIYFRYATPLHFRPKAANCRPDTSMTRPLKPMKSRGFCIPNLSL